jgi:hypothetical protein
MLVMLTVTDPVEGMHAMTKREGRPEALAAEALPSADPGQAQGENHAQRSTHWAKAVRIGPWTGVQRLFPAKIRRRARVPIDGGWTEEQSVGVAADPSGGYRLGNVS